MARRRRHFAIVCVWAAMAISVQPAGAGLSWAGACGADAIESAELTVLSHPLGAEVRVDGVFKGVTPLILSDLEPGSHTVRLYLEGYPVYEESIVLEAGHTFDLKVDLAGGGTKMSRERRAGAIGSSKGSLGETAYVLIGAALLTVLIVWFLNRSQPENDSGGGGGGKGPL